MQIVQSSLGQADKETAPTAVAASFFVGNSEMRNNYDYAAGGGRTF